MKYPNSLQDLIDSFMLLPGIGPKTAERLAYYVLLKLNDDQVKKFSESIVKAYSTVKKCPICGNLTDKNVCDICTDESRESTLMIVESSKDINALYKIADTNDIKIGMDILDYRGINNEYAFRFGIKAFRQTIIEEERLCFDVLNFRYKMEYIMSELNALENTEYYENITAIPEFEYALSQPASKGIQIVRYNNNVYFIPPMLINNNISDKVNLVCKNNLITNTKLMNFKILKSDGIVDVIYRQIIISR